MKNKLSLATVLVVAILSFQNVSAQDSIRKTPFGTLRHDVRCGRHYVQTDKNNNILPWLSADLGESYDYTLNLLWKFWDEMPYAHDGTKYYMVHRIWPFTIRKVNYYAPGEQEDDGIGGDQIQMMLDSWAKWYAYTGDPKVLDNMIYMADFYLFKGLSAATDEWPDLPYPWHSSKKAGFTYDGDLRDGKGVTQIDKAGDFGFQLINLYKITGTARYLDAAMKIADVLSSKIKEGDTDNSPLPYKVVTKTGKVLWNNTADWAWTMKMFDALVVMKKGEIEKYKKASLLLQNWIKKYAIPQQKYGPFFEDISEWSNTGINAGRIAEYILLNPEKWGESWQQDSRKALDFLCINLGNKNWKRFGVTVINEQSAYMYQGNSHTSRDAYVELLYAQKTGDTSKVQNSIRQLSWATYSVDHEGRNEYPGDPFSNEIWFTDGYGDFVTHYLNAMAILPDKLTPSDKDHLLGTTSVIVNIEYKPDEIYFTTFDGASTEVLRLTSKPKSLTVNEKIINESKDISDEGWTWKSLDKGGVLRVCHANGNKVLITK